MRTFQTREFDHASAPKVRPPANRARPNRRPTMNLEPARVNAAHHGKPTAGELVDPPVTCRYARPPTPRGHDTPIAPRTSTRGCADQLRQLCCRRAVEPQQCPKDQPPANGARFGYLQITSNSRAAHPTRQSCDTARDPRITADSLQLTSNAALTRCGTIVWFGEEPVPQSG